jgi:hypothetical protein
LVTLGLKAGPNKGASSLQLTGVRLRGIPAGANAAQTFYTARPPAEIQVAVQ